MRKVVTVQANTVEEATAHAIELIGLPIEEVRVEVLSNPGRRLMGLRKVMAEVMVTQLKTEVVEKPVVSTKLTDIEQIIDDMMTKQPTPSTNHVQKEESGSDYKVTGARIMNGKLEFVFVADEYPTITPIESITLYVNNEELTETTKVLPDDDVTIAVRDALIPPQFTIKLIEHEMIALLTFTPGQRIKRTLVDTPFKKHLLIEVSEEIEYYNDLKPQQIVDELKGMGIQQGIEFAAVKKVTDVSKPYELIVAKGQLPIEGTDGDLEVHINYEEFDPDGLEKVDFREMNAITNVIKDQVIATHIPPVPGTEGRSLLGKVIMVKPVRDILLRLGKNVRMDGENIMTTISGRPSLDWREKIVKIEVNHEFNHPGEVDIESGNIRFEGDVRIGGNILPSMFVRATGSVLVGGSVTKATVHAVKSAVINGNVLSSKISVGEQEGYISEVVGNLKNVVPLLEQIKDAIDQIFLIRGGGADELSPAELKRLIYLLLEKKYSHFEALNKEFIDSVKDHSAQLSEEWTDISHKFYAVFVNPLNEELASLIDFQKLIEDANMLIQMYGIELSPQSQLSLPYAINSELYSNGDIEITSKGVYHSILIAENNITIKGVCRGGEIRAVNTIDLQETGSESPVKTVVQTSATGRVKIGKAYIGTELQIGNRKHICSIDEVGIFARLNEEDELILR